MVSLPFYAVYCPKPLLPLLPFYLNCFKYTRKTFDVNLNRALTGSMRKAWRGSQAFQEKVFRFLWGVAKTI
jgi:hypothetical protein